MRRPRDGREAGKPHSVYLYPEEHEWLLRTFMSVSAGLRECMKAYQEIEEKEKQDARIVQNRGD